MSVLSKGKEINKWPRSKIMSVDKVCKGNKDFPWTFFLKNASS